jgi:hypothetical protein
MIGRVRVSATEPVRVDEPQGTLIVAGHLFSGFVGK